jgi:hypothetical protein
MFRIPRPKPFYLHPERRTLGHGDLGGFHGGGVNFRPFVEEPRQQYRWMLTFPPEMDLPNYFVSISDSPHLNIDRFQVNQGLWAVGQQRWDDIKIILKDAIGPNPNRDLRPLLSPLEDNQGYVNTIRKNFMLEKLGPVGELIDRWRITGIVTSYAINDMSWDTDEMDIEFTISPDRCVLEM